MRFIVFFILCFGCFSYASQPDLISDPSADNYAILVRVTTGLPGAEKDLENVRAMVTRPEFGFRVLELRDKDATAPVLRAMLTNLSRKTGERGTLLFYFGGHGGGGELFLGDKNFFTARDFKRSLSRGREGKTPLERLLVFIDACESGTFVDPWNTYHAFTRWSDLEGVKNVMLFTSSRGDENSIASDEGSNFTTALRQGFEESVQRDLSLGEWVDLTTRYTLEHHPVARFIPNSLSQEKLMRSP